MIHNRVDSQSSNSEDMDYILTSLEYWREAIVHFDGALNWENPKVLLLIFSFVNLLFGVYWLAEPSFLMTMGLLGILISSADYFGPKIMQRYVSGSWTNNKEAKYEDFCRRLLNARNHITKGCNFLLELRRERPYSYFLLVTPLLIIFTILGWKIDNLLLAYLITVFFLLVPGLRYKGLLQVTCLIDRLVIIVAFCTQIFTERLKPFLKSKCMSSSNLKKDYLCKYDRSVNGEAKVK